MTRVLALAGAFERFGSIDPTQRRVQADPRSPTDRKSIMKAEQERNSRLIDELVNAYNAQDVRRFAEDAWHGALHAQTFQEGRDAIYRRYVDVFTMYPGNRTQVLQRIAFDDFVIDHERVHRSADAVPFDVAAIYTIEGDRIKRLEIVRKKSA